MEYVLNTLDITCDIIAVHVVVVTIGIVITVIVVVVPLSVVSVLSVVPISGVAAAVLAIVVLAAFVASIVVFVIFLIVIRTVASFLYFPSHLLKSVINSVITSHSSSCMFRPSIAPRHSLVALFQLFSEICLISTTSAR